QFLRVLAMVMVLHMAWNAPVPLPFYVVQLALTAIAWMAILGFVQAGLKQVREEQGAVVPAGGGSGRLAGRYGSRSTTRRVLARWPVLLTILVVAVRLVPPKENGDETSAGAGASSAGNAPLGTGRSSRGRARPDPAGERPRCSAGARGHRLAG